MRRATAAHGRGDAVVAVIPARNESLSLPALLPALLQFVDTAIVVDDASDDDTARIAETHGATVIRHATRAGYSAAIRSGMARALERHASVVLTLDADGAHSPDDVPGLLASLQSSGFHIAIGDRWGPHTSSTVPTAKRAANQLASHLFTLAFSSPSTDVCCGLRALTAAAAAVLLGEAQGPGFQLVFETLLIARRHRWSVLAHPVSVHYDPSEMACTSRVEILDFLNFLAGSRSSQLDGERLAVLICAVEGLQLTTLLLGDTTFYFHPVRELDAFVVQAQAGSPPRRAVGLSVAL